MAIKFGLFLLLILLLSNLLKTYFGDLGTYVLAAVSGLADVDPLTFEHGAYESKFHGYSGCN